MLPFRRTREPPPAGRMFRDGGSQLTDTASHTAMLVTLDDVWLANWMLNTRVKLVVGHCALFTNPLSVTVMDTLRLDGRHTESTTSTATTNCAVRDSESLDGSRTENMPLTDASRGTALITVTDHVIACNTFGFTLAMSGSTAVKLATTYPTPATASSIVTDVVALTKPWVTTNDTLWLFSAFATTVTCTGAVALRTPTGSPTLLLSVTLATSCNRLADGGYSAFRLPVNTKLPFRATRNTVFTPALLLSANT